MKLFYTSFAFVFAALAVNGFVLPQHHPGYPGRPHRPDYPPPFFGSWDDDYPLGVRNNHKHQDVAVWETMERHLSDHTDHPPTGDVTVQQGEGVPSEDDYPELTDDKLIHKSGDFFKKHKKPKSCKKYKKKCEKGKKKSCKKYQKCCKKHKTCSVFPTPAVIPSRPTPPIHPVRPTPPVRPTRPISPVRPTLQNRDDEYDEIEIHPVKNPTGNENAPVNPHDPKEEEHGPKEKPVEAEDEDYEEEKQEEEAAGESRASEGDKSPPSKDEVLEEDY